MSQDTFYGLEGDGTIKKSAATYSEARDATEGILFDYPDPQDYIKIGQRYSDGPNYEVWRGFIYFDTSLIPANAIITEAILRLYIIDISGTISYDLVVMNGQPTYPHTILEVGDYDRSHYAGNGGSRPNQR